MTQTIGTPDWRANRGPCFPAADAWRPGSWILQCGAANDVGAGGRYAIARRRFSSILSRKPVVESHF